MNNKFYILANEKKIRFLWNKYLHTYTKSSCKTSCIKTFLVSDTNMKICNGLDLNCLFFEMSCPFPYCIHLSYVFTLEYWSQLNLILNSKSWKEISNQHWIRPSHITLKVNLLIRWKGVLFFLHWYTKIIQWIYQNLILKIGSLFQKKQI